MLHALLRRLQYHPRQHGLALLLALPRLPLGDAHQPGHRHPALCLPVSSDFLFGKELKWEKRERAFADKGAASLAEHVSAFSPLKVMKHF